MHKRHQQAFTLLEVMLALAILSLSLTAAMSSSSNTSRNIAYLADKTVAHWVAENQMARLLSGEAGYYLTVGQQRGQQQLAARQFDWQAQIEKYADQQLKVVVAVTKEGEPRAMEHLETYVREYLP